MKSRTKDQFILRHTRNAFITGIIVIAPLAATLWILSLLYKLIANPIAGPVKVLFGRALSPHELSLVSFFSMAVILLVVGFITNLLGRGMMRMVDRIMLGIPVVGSVYGTAKQFVDAVTVQKNAMFKRVVLVEFPYPGVLALGFVTREDLDDLVEANGKKAAEGRVAVFVPTTHLLLGHVGFYSKSKVVPLTLGTDEAIRMLLTAGTIGGKKA